ncbi:protein kinase domain-containing protein [Nocardia sp. CA-135398]|uniref:protein kinase domain-containing protein n=1 Tax=Nocardia sp. CA-135398 TaxID=3239977 RepID=UPI003D96444A
MDEKDCDRTQRDVGVDVVTELVAAGFADVVEIGRGGFGEVYRCTQAAADRTVAVKVLTGELDENRERFLREQRAMGRLTGHPNIVHMLEVGTTETGRPYLVMPYLARGSLEDLIRRQGPQPLHDVLRWGVKIAGALETAHRAGILHRDVKPGNILLTDYDEPALTDFGIAHITGGFHTATGTMTGSPAFTAPEILQGTAPSRASDVYGLAATLFCALTGHAAFERRSGEQVVAQFLRIAEHDVPDLRERGIPDDVSAVVETAMSPHPTDRPTAGMLGDQLREIERNHGLVVDEMALRAGPGIERPPLPSLGDNTAGNLPLELTSFIDRRAQVAEVKNRLATSRLVTLTGIGGVGKSRIALQVARKLASDFTDGVWLVELGELQDPALVPEVVATGLGLRHRGAEPTSDLLIRYLASRELLLVLDNCEHVIESATKLAESLLRACPRLKILATSREALNIGGESLAAIPPLRISASSVPSRPRTAPDGALALFAERAAAAVPSFQLTDANRDSVSRICARLDGLPLAIELAAARIRTMTPEQILSRLDDRYSLLTRGSRTAPKRQQTLQWSIGWSYDLCTTAEQRLWKQLSVFAGGFELDAAEQLCATGGTEAELLDALSALVSKSILIRDDADDSIRFRMLETVQEYGRQRAEEDGDYPQLSRRHRQWCHRLVLEAEKQWISPHQLQWVARLDRELPNLRKALESGVADGDETALQIAGALYRFWPLRGRLGEGRRWCERTLSRFSSGATAPRSRALFAAGVIAAIQSDTAGADSHLSDLATLAEQTRDPLVDALRAHAEANAILAGGGGDTARAAALLAAALQFYEVSGDLCSRLDTLLWLGWAHALQGETKQARTCYDAVLAITESAGETLFHSWAHLAIDFVVWREGEKNRAAVLLEKGLRSTRPVADPVMAASHLEISAWIAADRGNGRQAATLLGAADALGRIGTSTYPFHDLHIFHDDCIRRSREALGARVFEVEYSKGSAMALDAAIAFALGEHADTSTPAIPSTGKLTKRERQVVDLIAAGLSNKEIAARLVISQRTAEGHVANILTKLDLASRVQIATWAAD